MKPLNKHISPISPIGRRTFLAGSLAAAVAGATAACTFEDGGSGSAQESTGGASGGDGKTMVFRQSMVPVPHLDPHIGNPGSASGNILQGGLFEGLVVTDAEAKEVLPGVAEDWSMSDDGMVYTFNLRSDARWSNGDPVVADDFVWNYERLMSPDTPREAASPYSSKVAIAGAMAFVLGETDDFSTVGVKALDESTLELTLETLNPDFLFYLANWSMLPLHPGSVQEFPDSWAEPENWVSNGAFVLEAWRTNADATLVPNEEYWDRDTIHIGRWDVRFSDGGDSAEMVSYQADEVDIFRVEGDLASVTNDPAMAEELETSVAGQWRHLLLLNSANEALQDVRVRQALSLAIDRPALAELSKPDVPGPSLVPNGVPGYDEVPQTRFDPDKAKSLLAEAGYPGGEGMPTIQFLLPFPVVWVEAIGGMWRDNIGVQSAIDLVEVGVYREKRDVIHGKDYCGFQYGNIGANPPTLHNCATHSVAAGADFGRRLLPAEAAQQYMDVVNNTDLAGEEMTAQLQAIREEHWPDIWKRYEQSVAQAGTELDPDVRRGLLLEALTAREESYVALPVLWGGYSMMLKPQVSGLEVQTFPVVFSLKNVTVEQA